MPIVSIITCTWNSEKYLEECLESIRKQTFHDYEIIIVDGGSTDKTLEIVKKYNIKKVFTDIKGGVSRAMNHGIEHASGEIISILHSDDFYYSSSTLELVVSKFMQLNCKWLYGNLVRKKERQLSFQNNALYSKDIFEYTFNIPHPTVFVKKSVYDEIGMFDETYKYAMDYDLLLRISDKYIPCQIEQYLVVFREHEASLSTSNWSNAQKESLMIQQKHAKSFVVKGKGIFRFIKTRLSRLKTFK
ncbi:glycosyltransferase family 2 protein [Flavobacterium daemonense]|uniref:glycosyltransferase family 2 protein n=1 Tax=Flavobacterium daemonense TaxID=1393049 RepID=UPI001185158D|nr:glycosyltransferase family 2 protein [Flavobacterium daemonense]KAF2332509.1 glycosyltransferase [Flavobacterium daemonense]